MSAYIQYVPYSALQDRQPRWSVGFLLDGESLGFKKPSMAHSTDYTRYNSLCVCIRGVCCDSVNTDRDGYFFSRETHEDVAGLSMKARR